MDNEFFRKQREIETNKDKGGGRTTLEIHQIEQEKARQDPASLRSKEGLDDPLAAPSRARWIMLAGAVVIGIVIVVFFLANGGAFG